MLGKKYRARHAPLALQGGSNATKIAPPSLSDVYDAALSDDDDDDDDDDDGGDHSQPFTEGDFQQLVPYSPIVVRSTLHSTFSYPPPPYRVAKQGLAEGKEAEQVRQVQAEGKEAEQVEEEEQAAEKEAEEKKAEQAREEQVRQVQAQGKEAEQVGEAKSGKRKRRSGRQRRMRKKEKKGREREAEEKEQGEAIKEAVVVESVVQVDQATEKEVQREGAMEGEAEQGNGQVLPEEEKQ